MLGRRLRAGAPPPARSRPTTALPQTLEASAVCKPLLYRALESSAFWLGMVLAIAASALAAYRFTEHSGHVDLAQKAVHQLDLYAAGIESELGKYESLPGIVSLVPDLPRLLDKPDDPALRDSVNRTLLNYNVQAGSLAIMVLDQRGAVLASSNWYEADSPVGLDLSRASFFVDAVRNGHVLAFPAERLNGATYAYFSRSILSREHVVGVIAVQVSLAAMETAWIEYAASTASEKVLVVDDNGVIIMSSNPQWRYKTVLPMSSRQRSGLARTGRYAGVAFEPLPLDVEGVLSHGAQLVQMKGSDDSSSPEEYVAEVQFMSRPDWKLMTLSSTRLIRREARNAAFGAAGAMSFVALILLYQRQRRRAVAQLTAAHKALQMAKDELELRVEERTQALSAANAALVEENAERTRTEQSLREAQDELVRGGRLAMLGQMSAAITHEINQPLTALRALSDNSQRLLAAGRLDKVGRNLETIAGLTERMGRITAQLKTFARETPRSLGSVQLCHAVSNALDLISVRVQEQGVQVHLDMPHGLRVRCDGFRLEQVLVNLFSNALDAMKNAPVRQLTVHGSCQHGRVRIRVADTGEGLPEAVRQRLFEPFFSTKPPGEGLGLGLVISSGIVQEFGSSLTAVNLPQGGAAFDFELHLETESADAV